ncbi:MAG TPA: class I SAM-dependent methyltransferase [Rhizomicrobium sp.]|nr:class I SAM-dependent methyltransferase [Rhizomicrobium sp.]
MPDSIFACRSCGAPLSDPIVDLGEQPLANSYLEAGRLAAPEPKVPLRVRVCPACWLVQTDQFVLPENVFSDYAYFSSYSAAWLAHARRYSEAMIARFGLGKDSFVIEVASNDGYLLKNFVERNIPSLGIEPAENVAKVARAAGIPTEARFLGAASANDIAARHPKADLIAGNNVLAHVPDINDFVAGLKILLAPDGVLTLEFPHLLNLIARNQFDTIYHEHYSYLSLAAVERIFTRHGLSVFDVEKLPTHGGSLRLFVQHQDGGRAMSSAVEALRAEEKQAGVETRAYYAGFAKEVERAIQGFRAFLTRARSEEKKTVAYGAAAKGNTLLNACGIGRGEIDYVVDKSPHKQGRFLPGSHLEIFAPARILEDKPDYIVILPWNLREEIIGQLPEARSWNARFVTAIPQLKVIAP